MVQRNLPERIKKSLEDRKDTSLLAIDEIFNESVLSRGAVHESDFPLHAVNFSVMPSKEIYSPTKLEEWRDNLFTRKSKKIKTRYHNGGWDISSFNRSINLLGFYMGVIEIIEDIGTYSRITRFEHRSNIKDKILAERFKANGSVVTILQEVEGTLEFEDRCDEVFPDIYRNIWITPYLNMDHFENDYYGKGRDRDHFLQNKGESAVPQYWQRTMSLGDIHSYLSEDNKPKFRKSAQGCVKSKSMREIDWDEEDRG